jgi:hypothetical protein
VAALFLPHGVMAITASWLAQGWLSRNQVPEISSLAQTMIKMFVHTDNHQALVVTVTVSISE